jgi:hypothetical protein
MPKLLKLMVALAALGLAITLVIVVYLQLADPVSASRPPMNDRLVAIFVILCPPSLLSIPFIDAEPGTGGFYFLWSVIGLMNAVLYGGIGGVIGCLRLLWKSDNHSAQPGK